MVVWVHEEEGCGVDGAIVDEEGDECKHDLDKRLDTLERRVNFN